MKKRWENYEEVARYLLDQFSKGFGLCKVEGKQKVTGNRSGTEWEIDAKGIRSSSEGFIIIECRKHETSKQSQEKIGALAYRIQDTGAEGGIIVSPLGLQKGAQKIAKSENIIEVKLSANSTPRDFCIQFLNRVMVGVSENITISEKVIVTISRPCAACGKNFTVQENEKMCPSCSLKA